MLKIEAQYRISDEGTKLIHTRAYVSLFYVYSRYTTTSSPLMMMWRWLEQASRKVETNLRTDSAGVQLILIP